MRVKNTFTGLLHLILYVIFLFAPCLAIAEDAPKTGLYDAWTLALKNNEKVAIAGEVYYRTDKDVSRAYSQILPTLTIEGTHTRYSEKKTSSTGALLQPDYTSTLTFKAEQPLFSGGKEFSGIRQAKYLREGSETGLKDAKEYTIISASRAFYEYLNAANNYEIRKASLKRAEELLNAGKKNLSVGSATKADVLRAEAEVATKNAELVSAEGDLYNAEEYYKRVTGAQGDINLDSKMPDMDFWLKLSGNADELVALALKNRKDYKGSELTEKSAKEGVRYAGAYFLPTISLEGSYVRRDQSPQTAFFLEDVVSGGVTVRFPIFEGGLRVADYGVAKSKYREAELKRLGLRRDIELEVRKTFHNVKSASSLKEAYGKQLEFAKENYEVVFKQYKYGLADHVDLIEAETTLVSAELNFSKSSLSYELSVLELRRSIGTLYEDAISMLGAGEIK